METPNPNLPDPEPPGVGSSTHSVLSDQQKYALVALGGLTLVAVVLGLLARRRRAGAVADEFAAVPMFGTVSVTTLPCSPRASSNASSRWLCPWNRRSDA